MATKDNLQDAFSGESMANRKYLAFAKRADEDGYTQIAKLFRATAHAETIHAHAHLRVLGGIQDTQENLQSAVEGEAYEFHEMYPAFLEEARREGIKPAEFSFKNALAVEEIHHDLYSKALAVIKEGEDLPAVAIYVCPVCGYTVEGNTPANCPVCNIPGARFCEIE
jgi:rubrerythrin